jgi:uncharacterized protein YndB with AHSA1/START domain
MTTAETETALTTQVYQLFIKASPERVWEAITSSELTARYFHGAVFEGAPVVGGQWRSRTADGLEILSDGEIIEVDPPRRFVHGWRALYNDEMAVEEESRVTWELEPQEGGYTKLTLIHDRLEGAPKTAAGVAGGWMFILSSLKTLVETGDPIIDFTKEGPE